ncbi:hypothetical protein GLOTRDRAFT_91376 [Gloeophyllum trabeum ATCC 11539]|uniref:G protein-coupled receptor n=1 Tax=Gloeophyllum trabeum (strain ATCC 11539 / FP-39264 / Madison 617) TaxID=670483 RepID=S7RST6_GLOTA|nr:uncharacterized protein GLOTRDRAFT_91376 [Gloeophyllum trabeum ATCC 11539]EPQ57740.1 hypothetical protein GLOTRDRAFT_91376 [Gloeophyllum trabeum ATCC 11539]
MYFSVEHPMVMGTYVTLFIGCIRVLVTRKPSSYMTNRMLLLIMIVLFLLSTAEAVVVFLGTFLSTDIVQDAAYPGETLQALREKDTSNMLLSVLDAIIATNKLSYGNMALVHGVEWTVRGHARSSGWVDFCIKSSRHIHNLEACGYLLVYADICAYNVRLHAPLLESAPPPRFIRLYAAEENLRAAYYSTILATNIFLTVSIAGRVCWLNRRIQAQLGQRVRNQYKHVAVLIIESGAIYSICLVASVITLGPGRQSGLLEGSIVPTLLIVLICSGKATDPTLSISARDCGGVIGPAPPLGSESVDGPVLDITGDNVLAQSEKQRERE